MKRIAVILLLNLSCLAFGQKWVSPNYDRHHLDFRDLGYPGATEITADDSRISALPSPPDSRYVYGATSGKQAYLFLYDPYINKVRPLGQIEDCEGVHHALVTDNQGHLYIGTGLNLLDEIPLTRDIPGGHRQIEKSLWKDIKQHHAQFTGGRIYRYTTGPADEAVYLPEDEAVVEDLGLIKKNNSIYAMAFNPADNNIYGLTYPDADFFRLNPTTGEVKNFGPILSQEVYSGPERSWRTVPRALLCLENGDVITSGDEGRIIRFDIVEQALEALPCAIPGEYFESWNYYGYPVVEQLIQGEDGVIWGTTSDGFLFQLKMASETIKDMGKPRITRRVRAATMGIDGTLYMICGELGEPCKLISWDMKANDGYTNWSYISVDRSPYYAKRAYQFDAMATGSDGTIFIGESDRRGKLFLFLPGGNIFEGGLNRKNPR